LKIELIEIKQTEKSVLRQLLELYAYDFSEYDQADINQHGYYGYRHFDHYWTEASRHPFFIKVDDQLAVFVLVNDHCYVLKNSTARSIAEFFVMRKYRRTGVGRAAAFLIFDRFPGKWEVIQHGNNLPSQRFWEKVMGDYTNGDFQRSEVETESWKGQALLFENV
jgi:predicted acetyltransferase